MVKKMHVDEKELDEALVRRLLVAQFPHWADLSLRRIEPAGTVNAIFRLGNEYSVRLARRKGLRHQKVVSLLGCLSLLHWFRLKLLYQSL